MTLTTPSATSPSPSTLRVLFFGSGQFAVPTLVRLAADPAVDLVGVVSAPDRPAGRRAEPRPVPVTVHARRLGLRLLQPAGIRAPETVAALRDLRPDVGVLADFGRIVPATVLAIPPHGILNLHPSLLPRHRGATPIPATILAGDPVAGVSLIAMDEGLDTGPLVASASWPLAGTETTPGLEARAAEVAAELLVSSLSAWVRGELPAVPQATDGATLTRPHRRGDGRLDPALGAADLERRVRAFRPWPGTFLESEAGRLIVHRATVDRADDSVGRGAVEPGVLVAAGEGIGLVTGDGLLVLDEVQLAGGRPSSGADLVRGHRGLLGSRVAPAASTVRSFGGRE